MEAILISDHAKWCAKIMNGDKTIEIRKTMPKCDLPIDVYIYCTKGKRNNEDLSYCTDTNKWQLWYSSLVKRNGKVVAKFTLSKCQDWHNYSWYEICEKGCVSDEELGEYARHKKTLYIWEISNLKIFDKPKKLNEFWVQKGFIKFTDIFTNITTIEPNLVTLTKAPQNFVYVEVDQL